MSAGAISSSPRPTVLVTGGAGYIGSHIVLALKDHGYFPVVLDDLSTGFASAIPKDIPFIHASFQDRAAIHTVFRQYSCRAVIHCAGMSLVADSLLYPEAYYRSNAESLTDFLDICHDHAVRAFIQASTAAVYGTASMPFLSEELPLVPINPYGHSKRMAEDIILAHGAQKKARSIIFRYFNVAGADSQGRAGSRTVNDTHLVKAICEVATGRKHCLHVHGTDYATPDGTAIRDYVHVDDVAFAHILALQYLLNGGESQILNCASGVGFSVKDIIAAFDRMLDWPLSVQYGIRRNGDPPQLVGDIRRIQSVLGWATKYSGLDTILRTALNWEWQAVIDAERATSLTK